MFNRGIHPCIFVRKYTEMKRQSIGRKLSGIRSLNWRQLIPISYGPDLASCKFQCTSVDSSWSWASCLFQQCEICVPKGSMSILLLNPSTLGTLDRTKMLLCITQESVSGETSYYALQNRLLLELVPAVSTRTSSWLVGVIYNTRSPQLPPWESYLQNKCKCWIDQRNEYCYFLVLESVP